ncbi:ACP S-malonyltransferase [Candidatus Saccharibacteria bacterium]|nr:ACP S-malonyltransferase [Candidatus Saccharibacteria bacterium]
MFPGQSAQVAGMGEAAYNSSNEAKQIFFTASEVIGEDIAEICFGSQTDQLSTSLVQPAIVASELANYSVMRQNGLSPELMMGHSLGEIAALGASGVLSIKDVFRVTKVRAEVTERSSQSNPGGMAAFVGLRSEQSAAIVGSVNNYFHKIGRASAGYMANRNWSLEQVMSGHEDAIDRARRVVELLRALKVIEKARLVKLKVPGAFHSPHNEDGVDEFHNILASVHKNFPRVMLLNNQGEYMIDPNDFPDYYAHQLVKGVEWDLMMHQAACDGVRDFTEVVLSPDPKRATLSNFVMKEFPNHTVIEQPFGRLVRINWMPSDSDEFMKNRQTALTSLQEA